MTRNILFVLASGRKDGDNAPKEQNYLTLTGLGIALHSNKLYHNLEGEFTMFLFNRF